MRVIIVVLGMAACKGQTADPKPPPQQDPSPARSCHVVLTLTPADDVVDVAVVGEFGWDPMPLVARADGSWAADLGVLEPGTWAYYPVYDGAFVDPGEDVPTVWLDDDWAWALRVGDCGLPRLQVLSASATSDGSLQASLRFERAEGGARVDPDSLVVRVGDTPVEADVDPETGAIELAVTGLPPGKHSLRASAKDLDGNPVEDDVFVPLWVEDTPFDIADGLIYFVFTDRFRDGGDSGIGPTPGTVTGTDWMGGDLVGARQALEEGWFDELGVRTLWLSPVYENPDDAWPGSFGYSYAGYHGYWPVQPRAVEPHFGTSDVDGAEALSALVEAAHARGMRVMLDTVLNHVHQDHSYITEHPEWFGAEPCVCTTDPGACNWDTNPVGCWFTDYLPDLDYTQRELVDTELADLRWWLESFDVDGFRVDAAKHMDHVILRSLSLDLQARYEAVGGAEIPLIGETFTGQGGQGLIMQYVSESELDGQFDFPLYWALRNAIGQGGGFGGLSSEVAASDAAYGEHLQRMSVFMGNHDVPRYATDLAGCDGYDPYSTLFGWCPDLLDDGSGSISGAQWDLINPLAMSFAFVATQPGPPLLYYGDELGMAGGPDPDNRRMMRWTGLSAAQQTLLSRFQELGQARAGHRALRRGGRQELWVDDSLYVYARTTDQGDVAIIAMATAARDQAVPIAAELGLDGVTLSNLLDNPTSWTVSAGSLPLSLNAWEYVIMAP